MEEGDYPKYRQQGKWITKKVNSSYGTCTWKVIRKHWEEYALNIGFTVSNGRKISFWSENWLGPGPFKDLLSDLFCSTTPEATIQETWISEGLNFSFKRVLNDWRLEGWLKW